MTDQQQEVEQYLVLMTRKGVYSYEYMYSFERLPEPQLPPKDAFYSSLTEEDISQRDYTHAQRVLNHFDTTYFKHYHNFGLLTDVLLLAKVLENFRDL